MNEPIPPTGVDYEAIRTFQAFCHANSRRKGFHDTPDRLKELADELVERGEGDLGEYILQSYTGNRLMLIVGEVSEGHEEIRAGHAPDETYYPGTSTKPEGLPSEVADIFIRLMDFCEEFNIDLADAIRTKLAYNATRQPMHGGKKF